MLYACYDLIQLDVVMEISWRYGLNDYTMVGYLFDPRNILYMLTQTALYDKRHETANQQNSRSRKGQ
jgi:hypothetical protein